MSDRHRHRHRHQNQNQNQNQNEDQDKTLHDVKPTNDENISVRKRGRPRIVKDCASVSNVN